MNAKSYLLNYANKFFDIVTRKLPKYDMKLDRMY